MKPISTHIQEILKANKVEAAFPEGVNLVNELLEAIKSRDSYCLGKEDPNPYKGLSFPEIPTDQLGDVYILSGRIAKRSDIAERMKKSL